MSKARRLTEEERLRIAKERSEGVPATDLAQRFGVSLKSVYNAVHHAQGRRISNGTREQVVSLRLTRGETRNLDAALSARGIAHRSDALRALVLAASDLLIPDALMTEELRSLGAALNRVGNNVNQIARRLNEDRVRGEGGILVASDKAEIRALAELVFTIADQVQEMSRNRRMALKLKVDKALAPLMTEAGSGEACVGKR
jgi:transposase-like protein